MADLVGAHVTLAGLNARPDLNGRRGMVLSYSAERGRVGVKIEGEPKPLSLKPSSLAVVELQLFSLDADTTLLVLLQLPAVGLARLACVSRATRNCVDACVAARKAALGARLPPWAAQPPNGPLLSAIHFVELQDGLPLRSLAAGSTFSLVVSPKDGRVYSFGGPSEPGGSVAHLGLGDNQRVAVEHPTAVSATPSVVAAYSWGSVVAGDQHAALMTRDQEPVLWGNNAHGQLGSMWGSSGSVVATVGTPFFNMMRNVGGATPAMRGLGNQKFVQVAVGRQHTLALNGSGMVLACGSNDFGQCGSEHPGDQPASTNFEMGMLRALQFGIICEAVPTAGPPPPPRPLRIVQIAAGLHHSCAVSMGGVLLTWGSGTYGKLGHGDERDRHIPKIVESDPATPVPAFAAVSAGAQHTIALSDRGELYAWGRNTEGQCGIARQKESRSLGWRAEALAESRPRRVVELFEQPRWNKEKDVVGASYGVYDEPLQEKIVLTQISAGHNHSAALASDGSVFMFGRGNKGQVGRRKPGSAAACQGLQSRFDSPVPTRVGGALGGVKVVEVACGGEHTLARTVTGHTYAWGSGQYGQVGLGDFVAMVMGPKLIESEVLDPGVAVARPAGEAPGEPPATPDGVGSRLRRVIPTVRRVRSFISYVVAEETLAVAVFACLVMFLPVYLGVYLG